MVAADILVFRSPFMKGILVSGSRDLRIMLLLQIYGMVHNMLKAPYVIRR